MHKYEAILMMTVKETEWSEIRKCGSYIQNIKKKKIKKKETE